MFNPVYQVLKKARPLWGDQGGITGLETAIVLIAFVVVSSVFAFAALSTGLFTTDRAKETIHAGLSQARSTMEMRGSILAEASTGTTGAVVRLRFQIANAAAGEPIDMTPGRTVIKYTDVNQTCNFDNSNEFTTAVVGTGDSDTLLESGEVFEVIIPPTTGNYGGSTPATALTEMLQANTTGVNGAACVSAVTGTQLGTATQFTLEIIPPKGATLYIQRTTPISFQSLESLN